MSLKKGGRVREDEFAQICHRGNEIFSTPFNYIIPVFEMYSQPVLTLYCKQ